MIFITKKYIQQKQTLHRMLPSSVDSRGLLGPSPPGNAFLASSVSCFIWRHVNQNQRKIATVCSHIHQLFCYSAISIQPPTMDCHLLLQLFSSANLCHLLLVRPPSQVGFKSLQENQVKISWVWGWKIIMIHTFWQETVSLHTSHFIGTAWNGKSEHRNNAAFILLFSFGTSSTFVVAPWLFKRHTWVVWSFR